MGRRQFVLVLDEWCERWAAALDATRDLEWAEILAVISGSAVRALPPILIGVLPQANLYRYRPLHGAAVLCSSKASRCRPRV